MFILRFQGIPQAASRKAQNFHKHLHPTRGVYEDYMVRTVGGGDPVKLFIKRDANGKTLKTRSDAKLLVKVMREEYPDKFDDDRHDLHYRPSGTGDAVFVGARKVGRVVVAFEGPTLLSMDTKFLRGTYGICMAGVKAKFLRAERRNIGNEADFVYV